MKLKKLLRNGAERFLDGRYEKKLKQLKLDYMTWIDTMSSCDRESLTEEEAASPDDFTVMANPEGHLATGAYATVKSFFHENPQVLLAYGDEDVIVKGCNTPYKYENPWLKPDWSPDTFLDRDYLGNVIAVRNELLNRLREEKGISGGNSEFSINDLEDEQVLRYQLVKAAGGFEKGCDTIAHMKDILFHGKEDWRGYLKDLSDTGTQNFEKKESLEPGNQPLVSIIIPSKDNVSVLKHCVDTLRQTIHDCTYEIIIVDNGSGMHSHRIISDETEKINQELTNKDLLAGIQYVYEVMEFNFSRMCNLGAAQAKGSFFLFLNDDIEAVEAGWLKKMLEKAKAPWVGAVGMKLWYPDSDKIQHAGITNITIGPVHKLQFLKDNKCYYENRNHGVRNVLAVTGACLLIESKKFAEVKGFSEEMHVAFNDVDLCFSLFEAGYHNVVINSTHMLHHESLSRGADESEEKLKRLFREREILYTRHPKLKDTDPYYHPWLNQNALDTRIVPAYEEGKLVPDERSYEQIPPFAGIHKNDCVLLRVEFADKNKLQGYAVVLGSDNACFEKTLLLKSKNKGEAIYKINFTGQYRSDLVENMPDQKNIALSGFQVSFKEPLPKGEYKIGVVVKDKISGLQLLNWSNKTLVV